MKNTHKYDDIIHLPRHVSPKRSPMSVYDRAAQFSPFAALTGYDGVIRETARLTDNPVELDEGGKALLDEKLQLILMNLTDTPLASFTCFRPDDRKSGGEYVTISGYVKKIDPIARTILLTDGRILALESICAIETDCVSREEMV